MSTSNKPVRPAAKSSPSATSGKPRSPWVAVGLSFALPGAGQIYNGDKARGIALCVVSVSVAVYATYLITMAILAGMSEDGGVAETGGLAGLLAGVVFPGLMLVAMVDAWFGAHRANARR